MDFLEHGWNQPYLLKCGLLVFGCFFALLGSVLVPNFDIFTKVHARRHRVAGLAYLIWLIIGLVRVGVDIGLDGLAYHVGLGILGVTVTLTAAFDFKFHERVKNKASGTLEKDTTVTYSEMIEHSFYQGLNLVQILLLHVLDDYAADWAIWQRALLTMVATAPWLARPYFPVNSFSANYKDLKLEEYSMELLLYRIKKWQYVFYKHVLLHGLNITVATRPGIQFTHQPLFDLYWLFLNTSYVMEFFLQTLVKKRKMSQQSLLWLQKLLMGAGSVAAFYVFFHVRVPIAFASHILNMTNRKQDFLNTGLLLCTTMFVDSYVF